MSVTHKPDMSRRRFLRYGLGVGIGFGLVGAGSLAKDGEPYVTVPRALAPEDFSARCIRCGACVQVCPTRALAQRDLSLRFTLTGVPMLTGVRGGCTAWKDACKKCAEACPSGAISASQELDLRWPGLATFDPGQCTNCMACFRACPREGAVLFPNPAGGAPFTKEQDIPFELKIVNSPLKPYINPACCVGCGNCVARCIPKIMYLVPTTARL